jgi:tetratricopeptide (TPR) repeat protein
MTVIGASGTEYQLAVKVLNSGGEGDIYRVLGGTDKKLVKIYHSDVNSPELEEKLKIMVKRPPGSRVLTQVAWPLDIVYDTGNTFRGFVMPRLNINAELSDIYKYPQVIAISSQQKLVIAENICAVISAVHKAGYVFGDFNPRNIGVDKNTGKVAFLDTDSYHVTDKESKRVYRCTVCAPGYSAPELLEKCADHVSSHPSDSKQAYAATPLPTFTQETDNFALAAHIFKLLNNGYTPFGGIKETDSPSQASPGTGDAAVRRDNYCFKPGNKPQSAAIPPLDIFPQEAADLFTRAFMYGKIDPKQRPSAVEWHSVLEKYESTLTTCSKNALHQYDGKNTVCPWCEADRLYELSIGPAIKQKQYSSTTTSDKPPVNPYRSSSKTAAKSAQNSTRPPVKKSTMFKLIAIAIFISGIILIPIIRSYINQTGSSPVRDTIKEISYSDFTDYLEQNQIESVTIFDENVIECFLKGSTHYKIRIPPENTDLLSVLTERNVNISSAVSNTQSSISVQLFNAAQSYFDRGVEFSNRNDWDTAIQEFTDSIRMYPKFVEAYKNRGLAYFNKKDYDRAIADYTEAIKIGQTDTSTYSERGLAYFNKKDYDRAIADYTEVIRLDPNNSVAFDNRIKAYLAKSDYNSVIADYTQAIRLDPNNISAYSGRGDAYRKKNDNDSAIADYNQAINLDPSNSDAYYYRGLAYSNKKDYDRAIADYSQTIRLNQNNTDAYYYRGRAYGNKEDYDRAISDYSQAIRLNPNNVDAYYYRGRAYDNKKNYTQAIADYEQWEMVSLNYSGVFIGPNSYLKYAYFNRGDVYFERKDWDRAIADYSQAIRLDPKMAIAYDNRGAAYNNKGNYTQAISDYEEALKIDPDNTFAKNEIEHSRRNRGW